MQPHALVYLIGVALFIVLFIMALLFKTLFGNACDGFCCCCLRKGDKNKTLQTYSNNFYEELSVEDMKSEYSRSKTELNDYRLMIQQGLVTAEEAKAFQLFLARLDNKLRTMKLLLTKRLLNLGINPANDTLEGYDQLFKQKKNDAAGHRLRALYSYDIKDNPDFIKSQKIEKRIRKFYGMQ